MSASNILILANGNAVDWRTVRGVCVTEPCWLALDRLDAPTVVLRLDTPSEALAERDRIIGLWQERDANERIAKQASKGEPPPELPEGWTHHSVKRMVVYREGAHTVEWSESGVVCRSYEVGSHVPYTVIDFLRFHHG